MTPALKSYLSNNKCHIEKEDAETRVRYLINKHQIMLFKTILDEKQ